MVVILCFLDECAKTPWKSTLAGTACWLAEATTHRCTNLGMFSVFSKITVYTAFFPQLSRKQTTRSTLSGPPDESTRKHPRREEEGRPLHRLIQSNEEKKKNEALNMNFKLQH